MFKSFLKKTFAGLSAQCYIRHFIFGAAISIIFFLSTMKSIYFGAIFTLIINAVLYPYSRFIYETIVNYVMGNNKFLVDLKWFFIFKIITIVLCWGLAIFIAPIGLLYLYFYHSKQENDLNS